VLCVTDGSRAGTAAVRQAALLTGEDGRLDLLALAPDPAPGRPRPQAAQIEALVSGSAVASRGGVHSIVHIAETSDEAAAVAESSRDHGLLVLAAGPLAGDVLPRVEVPVLVARPGADRLDSVLAAVDGSPEAHAAALLGARLAALEHADLALVAAPEHDAAHQHALQRDAAAVERITGRRPLILDEHGAPVASILNAATTLDASLIVLGSRPGRPADSVSAEVAERADCSVLVLRPGRAVSSRA
jgi:nucleotide-binding universal stress UspA family protein